MEKPINLVIEEAKSNIVGATLQAINDNPIPASILKMIITELSQNIINASQKQIEAEASEYVTAQEEAKEDGTEH